MKKTLKIIGIIFVVLIILGLIFGEAEEKKNKDNTTKNEKKQTTENVKTFNCDDTGDYEYEYTQVLTELYPYGYKVHRIADYTLYKEEETSCLYKTSITITNEYGASAKHTMYIGTNLDKRNKKETLKNIMIDNIYVYEKED